MTYYMLRKPMALLSLSKTHPPKKSGSFSLDLRSGHRIGVCRGGPRPRGVLFFFWRGEEQRILLDDGVIKVYMMYGKSCQFSSNDEFSGFKLLAVKTFEITL